MAYSGDFIARENVPTFSFTLPNLTKDEDIPNLFSTPQNTKNKRKPGFLTNIQKTTVSHLLEVFRPELQTNQDAFQLKKRLVTNAIHAIYEHKKERKQYCKNAEEQNQQTKLKQFQRSDSYIYRTPPKSKKLQEESLETTRLSSSQSKLNYSRSEQKFKTEEIFKLRKRAGVK